MNEADRIQLGVAECQRLSSSLAIIGHGSKALLGPLKGEDTLSTQSLSGIIDYRPEELVVTAWAGTSLGELTETLAEKRQMLPFDPPRFDGIGTLGGALASGLSGPARPWRGSVRDAVLGVEIVNGRGQRLRFGGSVMKNVAGYDVSRLMVGARGTLGVILSASVRVLPMPATEATLAVKCDAREAGRLVRDWARRPLPITATCYLANTLHLRLSGSAAGVASARSVLGLGESGDPQLWAAVRDHAHPFFADSAGTITRVSLPRGSRFDAEGALIEWGGCQAWSPGGPVEPPDGGFATTFSPGRQPSTRPLARAGTAKVTARLKEAFDPSGVLNPGVEP
ncbi:MAG: glycolate oxidase subunit GlcE [Gammaproteobacteria bacterium]|nr:glycolate oxidase subunit GlcE [Gammaproteobacteria bacterium]